MQGTQKNTSVGTQPQQATIQNNILMDEAKKLLEQHSLVSFSLKIKENASGKKEIIKIPPWSRINLSNNLEFINKYHNCLCIRTGKTSMITVLDFDNKDDSELPNGFTKWNQLLEEYGEINTWIAKSPNGGLHYYFKYDERTAILNTTTNIMIDNQPFTADIRNNLGLIFCPPTWFISNTGQLKTYEWIKSPYDTELAEMPEWVLDKLSNDYNTKKSNEAKNGVIKRVGSTNIKNPDMKLMANKIKIALKLDIYKSYNKGEKIYIFYSGKCITCDKEHVRKDGQFMMIFTDIHNLMSVTFKCFHDPHKWHNIRINRNNPHKILYSSKELKTMFPLKQSDIEILQSFLPTGICEVVFEGRLNKISDTNKIPIKKINTQYLKAEDIEIFDYDSIYLISIEGTAKSYATSNIIKVGIPGIERYIIINPNIGTLSSIYATCKELGVEALYYENATREELQTARVVIITINSLHKLVEDNELPKMLNKSMVWLDEMTMINNYYSSTTIDENRHQCFWILEMFALYSKKLIVSDADLYDTTIGMISDFRHKSSIIIQNEYLCEGDKVRHYHINNTYNETVAKIKESLDNNEKIVIVSDSKTVTDIIFLRIVLGIYGVATDDYKTDKSMMEKYKCLLDDHIGKYKTAKEYNMIIKEYNKTASDNKKIKLLDDHYETDGVLLINSEHNNDSYTLQNLNDIIVKKNIKVFLYSPSVSVGTSIDVKHFDRLFAIFKGSGPLDNCGQQQLNRVRTFSQKDHYLTFLKATHRPENITEQQAQTDYLKSVLAKKNISKSKKKLNPIDEDEKIRVITAPVFKDTELINGFEYNDDEPDISYKTTDFITGIVVFNKVAQRLSNAMFKYRVLMRISERGHKIFVSNKKYELMKKNSNLNKINNAINKAAQNHIVDIKVDEMVEADTINSVMANELIETSRDRKLTSEEQIKLNKYIIGKRYHIRSDIDKITLKSFYNEIRNNNYYEKAQRLLAYYCYIHLREDYTERDALDKISREKMDMIHFLLKKIGFTGIMDESTVEYTNTDIVPEFTDILKKKIQTTFSENNNCGLFQGKPTYKKITNLICRITYEYLGASICNENSIRRKTEGKRYCTTNIFLYVDQTIMDYFYIGLDERNLNTKIEMSNQRIFKRTEIHNIKGLYETYIKTRIDKLVENKKDAQALDFVFIENE